MQAQQGSRAACLYVKQQVGQFRQACTFSVMLGRQAIKFDTMLRLCKEHARDNTTLGDNISVKVGLPRDGKFIDMAINGILHDHSVPAIWLYPLARHSGADMFLRKLPADDQANQEHT